MANKDPTRRNRRHPPTAATIPALKTRLEIDAVTRSCQPVLASMELPISILSDEFVDWTSTILRR